MLIIKNILLAMLNGLKRRAAKFGVAGKGEMLIVYRVVFFFSFFLSLYSLIIFFPAPVEELNGTGLEFQESIINQDLNPLAVLV